MKFRNWKILILCLIASGLFLAPVLILADQAKGSKEISINGGNKGNILLPHHLHQAAIKDCQTCHAVFAQEPGAIDTAKKTGDLKKKQVMNKTCLKCHRAMKKAGDKTGPTSCSGCHIK
jgi:hypothetical protein